MSIIRLSYIVYFILTEIFLDRSTESCLATILSFPAQNRSVIHKTSTSADFVPIHYNPFINTLWMYFLYLAFWWLIYSGSYNKVECLAMVLQWPSTFFHCWSTEFQTEWRTQMHFWASRESKNKIWYGSGTLRYTTNFWNRLKIKILRYPAGQEWTGQKRFV